MNRIIDMRYYKVAWITVFCLAIEQTADTSFLSGKGMGYCMLIALCLNANRNLLMERAKIRKLIAQEKKLVETLQNPDADLSLKKEKQ